MVCFPFRVVKKNLNQVLQFKQYSPISKENHANCFDNQLIISVIFPSKNVKHYLVPAVRCEDLLLLFVI